MNTLIQQISIKDLYNLIKKANLTIDNKENLHKISEKSKSDFAKKFMTNIDLTIYVSNIDSFIQNNNVASEDIKYINDSSSAFLFYSFFEKFEKELSISENKIDLVIKSYKKESIKLQTFQKFITLTEVTDKGCINQNKLNNIFSDEEKKAYFKNCRKNSISYLFSYKRPDKRCRNEKTKYSNSITLMKNLSSERFNLTNKYAIVECPICLKKLKINEENINQFIIIKDDKFQLVCNHEKINADKLPFSFTIDDVTKKIKKDIYRYTKDEKLLFFINNYTAMSNFKKSEHATSYSISR